MYCRQSYCDNYVAYCHLAYEIVNFIYFSPNILIPIATYLLWVIIFNQNITCQDGDIILIIAVIMCT